MAPGPKVVVSLKEPSNHQPVSAALRLLGSALQGYRGLRAGRGPVLADPYLAMPEQIEGLLAEGRQHRLQATEAAGSRPTGMSATP